MLQIEILETSFKKIEPKISEFATSFYGNLFLMYPEAKGLFANTEMEAQKKKLVDSLAVVILNLRYPEFLSESLKGLGTRHVQYGALPEHYPAVGHALLHTFEQYLGEEWTPEIKQAWVEAYEEITKLMLEGADYSQKQVSLELDSDPVVQKEINLNPEFSSASEQQNNNSSNESLDEKDLEFDEQASLESSQESLENNKINWGILAGIAAMLIVGLIAIILPKLQKDQSPSSQPNSSLIK